MRQGRPAGGARELRMVIEREVTVVLNDPTIMGGAKNRLGGEFSILWDGLTVSEVEDTGPLHKAGLFKDDLIALLDGQPTRYMPLSAAYGLVEKTKKENIEVSINREIVLWKR